MRKITKVSFEGGFHRAGKIILHFREPRAYVEEHIDEIFCLLSEYQEKKLEANFCGIEGCSCGSWTRANIEILN